ncbi:MAG: hypothetical protein AABX30_00615 [Nanoarchaeota archaeon]
MSRLKYYIRENKKTYTLKEKINDVPTKDAHYKFVNFLKTKNIVDEIE